MTQPIIMDAIRTGGSLLATVQNGLKFIVCKRKVKRFLSLRLMPNDRLNIVRADPIFSGKRKGDSSPPWVMHDCLQTMNTPSSYLVQSACKYTLLGLSNYLKIPFVLLLFSYAAVHHGFGRLGRRVHVMAIAMIDASKICFAMCSVSLSTENLSRD